VRENEVLDVFLMVNLILIPIFSFTMPQQSAEISCEINSKIPLKQLNIVYQSVITSRIQYAVSAWGEFVAEWKPKTDSFLMRAIVPVFVEILCFTLLFAADKILFQQQQALSSLYSASS
jgi:hypothetical protein